METENLKHVETVEEEKRVWRWLFGTGVFTMALGIAAVLLPFIATLTLQVLIAAVLIAAGVILIINAVQSRKSKGLFLRLLVGLLYGVVGIMLLAFPLQGTITLTLLLIVLFMIAGAFKIALALYLRPLPSWGWLMLSGIVSAILAILIWMGLPGTAAWAIGLLVGIELIFSGWTMIMFAFSVHHYTAEEEMGRGILHPT